MFCFFLAAIFEVRRTKLGHDWPPTLRQIDSGIRLHIFAAKGRPRNTLGIVRLFIRARAPESRDAYSLQTSTTLLSNVDFTTAFTNIIIVAVAHFLSIASSFHPNRLPTDQQVLEYQLLVYSVIRVLDPSGRLGVIQDSDGRCCNEMLLVRVCTFRVHFPSIFLWNKLLHSKVKPI